MPRPLNDSPYLYGLHDPGGEQSWPSKVSPAGFCSPRNWATIRATKAAATTAAGPIRASASSSG